MNARNHPQPAVDPVDDRRFEVRFEPDETGRRRHVVLREFGWGPGVGWYVVKTLRLDPSQVDALLGALCCARQECSAGNPQDNPARQLPCGEGQVLSLEDLRSSA